MGVCFRHPDASLRRDALCYLSEAVRGTAQPTREIAITFRGLTFQLHNRLRYIKPELGWRLSPEGIIASNGLLNAKNFRPSSYIEETEDLTIEREEKEASFRRR